MTGNLLAGRGRKQLFFQHERVESVGIIAGHGFHNEIMMTFVEGKSGGIIDGGLQHHACALAGSEAVFGGGEKMGANSEAARVRQNVNGNDVALVTTIGGRDQEPEYPGLV
jgi:hypothetical protein